MSKPKVFLPEINDKRGSSASHRSSSANSSRSSSAKMLRSPPKHLSPIDKPRRESSTVKSADVLSKNLLVEKEGDVKHTNETLGEELQKLSKRLAEVTQYDSDEGKDIQEAVSQTYWKYPELASESARLLAKGNYISMSVKMLKALNEVGIFKSDKVWFPTYFTYNALWNYSNVDIGFSVKTAEAGIMSLLMANLAHKPYLEAMDSPNVTYVLKASIGMLANIARCHKVRHMFKDYKTKEIISPFKHHEDEYFKLTALLLVCYLVEEQYLSYYFSKDDDVVKGLCDRLGWALDDPNRMYHSIHACSIAKAVVTLAAYDELKQQLTDDGAVELFIRLLDSDKKEEVKIGLEGLWSLSFNKDAKLKLHNNQKLMATMKKIMEGGHHHMMMMGEDGSMTSDKEFLRLLDGAKFQMKAIHEPVPVKDESGETPVGEKPISTEDSIGHVFLSYSWANQPVVLQISNRLKESGYKVWIDVDQMNGDTLEAMARAVEEAAVVLICVSEPYKESSNTRTEAEYTFNLKKPYVPCYMEKKYKPDGWLGALVGSKIYVDFTGKDPFEKSFSTLRKEIGNKGKIGENPAPLEQPGLTSAGRHSRRGDDKEDTLSTNSWTKEQVQSWLKEKHLTGCMKALEDYDGPLLTKLSRLREEVPSFYYQCIDTKFGWSVADILNFTDALDRLQYAS